MIRVDGKKYKALHVPQAQTCVSVTGCPCVKPKNLAQMVLLAIEINQLLRKDSDLLLDFHSYSTTLFHVGAHPLSHMSCLLVQMHSDPPSLFLLPSKEKKLPSPSSAAILP